MSLKKIWKKKMFFQNEQFVIFLLCSVTIKNKY